MEFQVPLGDSTQVGIQVPFGDLHLPFNKIEHKYSPTLLPSEIEKATLLCLVVGKMAEEAKIGMLYIPKIMCQCAPIHR